MKITPTNNHSHAGIILSNALLHTLVHAIAALAILGAWANRKFRHPDLWAAWTAVEEPQ